MIIPIFPCNIPVSILFDSFKFNSLTNWKAHRNRPCRVIRAECWSDCERCVPITKCVAITDKTYIHPGLQIAISSKCRNKEAAWQFLKYFLTEDYQQKIDGYIPLSKIAFEKLLDTAENSHYINENEEIIISKNTDLSDNKKIDLGSLSKAEAIEFKHFVETTSSSYYENAKIASIISEEANYYFNGEKSAEDVAAIVQSKVSLYLSENMKALNI